MINKSILKHIISTNGEKMGYSEQLDYYQSKLSFEMDSYDLYSSQRDSEKIIVVDGRSQSAYTKEHIPNAINLPHREIDTDLTKNLDRDMIYICYCDGIGCNASTKTALKLLRLGFNVKELIGGLDWWKRDGYATAGEESQVGLGIECGC